MNESPESEVPTPINSHTDLLLERKPESSDSPKTRLKRVHRFKTYEAFNDWKAYEMMHHDDSTQDAHEG